MASQNATLFSLRGRVRQTRPCPPQLADAWINDRIRETFDRKIVWSDLVRHTTISWPAVVSTGVVNMTTGSVVVVGTGTNWPVADVTNTTCPSQIVETGYITIFMGQGNMVGIQSGSSLYIDDGGNPEVIPVFSTTATSFETQVQFTHNANFTVTQSSLAGLQFRTTTNDPVFTVRAITPDSTLLLDTPWGNASLVNSPYFILKMYFTVDPYFREFLTVKDTIQGIPLVFHISQQTIDLGDPQRTNSGPPVGIADRGPDWTGNTLFELWPAQQSAYQIDCLYVTQWPRLVNDTDRAPWFINPNVFVQGALADAHRYRHNEKDPFFNLTLAAQYESKYDQLLSSAENSDDAKWLSTYTSNYQDIFGSLGSRYWVNHDVDTLQWNL